MRIIQITFPLEREQISNIHGNHGKTVSKWIFHDLILWHCLNKSEMFLRLWKNFHLQIIYIQTVPHHHFSAKLLKLLPSNESRKQSKKINNCGLFAQQFTITNSLWPIFWFIQFRLNAELINQLGKFAKRTLDDEHRHN